MLLPVDTARLVSGTKFIYEPFFMVHRALPMIVKSTGIRIYDFNFRDFLECRSILADIDKPVVLRIGAIAEYHAKRLNLSFLVVDVAKLEEGKWIVIEVNDAQESGYAGISPIHM